MTRSSRDGPCGPAAPDGSTNDRSTIAGPDDDAAAAGRAVDRERLVRDLCDMIEIPSVNPLDDDARPGFREQELAEYYLDRMSAIGMEVGSRVVVPGRPNAWGTLKGDGTGPSLMLCGHLDTVGTEGYPDALRAIVADGRVHGRGSCDMKAGLAAYLEVARLVRDSGVRLRGDLLIAGIADEEHLMIGSRDLGAHGPWADHGIIGEPTDLRICPAHKGQLGFRIRTFGKAVHSSRPERGVNAIEAMARVVAAFGDYSAKLAAREAHPVCGHARSCCSVIRGGTIVSTVPDFCEMEVDRRTVPGETGETVAEEYRRLLDPLVAAFPGFRYEIAGPTLQVGPLDTPLDHPLVAATLAARERVLGGPGPVEEFPGGTDAPNLGFPALVFGPGALLQAHSTDEYVAVDDVVAATRIYLATAFDLLAG